MPLAARSSTTRECVSCTGATVASPFSILSSVTNVMAAIATSLCTHFPTIDAYRPAEVPKQGDDDAETNTLTELGFPDAVEETIPVFTLLPQILPIPPGFSVPVGIKVDQPLPPGQTYHPAFEAWCAAVRHCHSYNSGKLLNTPSANRLFHATSFDDWAELHAVATNDPTSVETSHPLTPVPDHSAPAVAIRDRITAISEASLLYWYQDTSLSDQESQFSPSDYTPATGNILVPTLVQ
ncbi:hypothetical protein IV203_023040 [Nitzschia inconspicua]|uniref:Uncharacterized protein n=1 Tax=Nitzschia inconspicua TaxID=303405 RepID=A0A9K3KC78_9STRA|nr:hypothetical protein IV203_023040 [Nitzschia inconspicua]